MTAEPNRHGNTIIFPASLDPRAVGIVERLNGEGFESYLVGGCVRDLLLGQLPKDFDVSTAARPRQVRRTFRNCRIIGRRFKLAHVFFGDEIIEVATFRQAPAESKEAESEDTETSEDDELLITRDNVFGTAEQDARRRDFTMNALFYDVATHEVIDYVGGVEDIEARLVRMIGDPTIRLAEDPVRILRAVKFASRLDLSFESELEAALHSCAALIEQSAPPRVLEEIYKLLSCGRATRSLELLLEFGVFKHLLPEFAEHWEANGEQLVRIGAALDHLDQGRRQLPNAFILAALAHDAWRAELVDEEVDPLEAANELLTPLALRMSVPRRDVAAARGMLMNQLRLERKRRSRRFRMREFLQRQATVDAIDLLYLRALCDPELAETHAGWAQRLAEVQPAPQTAAEAKAERDDQDDGPPKRRRRRRSRGGRRRRRGGSAATQAGETSEDGSEPSSDAPAESEAPRTKSRRAKPSRAASDAGEEADSETPAAPEASTGPSEAPELTETPAAHSAATRPPAAQKDEPPARLGGRLKRWVKKVLSATDDPPVGAPAPSSQDEELKSKDKAGDSNPAADAKSNSTAERQDTSSAAGANPASGSDDADGEAPRPKRRRRGGRRRRRGGAKSSPSGEAATQNAENSESPASSEQAASKESSEDNGQASGDAESSPKSESSGKKRRSRRGGRGRKRSSEASGGAKSGEEKSSDAGGDAKSKRSGKKRSSSGSGKSRSSSSSRRGDKPPRSRKSSSKTTKERDDFDPNDDGPSGDQRHPEDVEDVFDW